MVFAGVKTSSPCMPVPSNFIRWRQALPKEMRTSIRIKHHKSRRVDHEPRERAKIGSANTYKRRKYIYFVQEYIILCMIRARVVHVTGYKEHNHMRHVEIHFTFGTY